VNNAMQWLPSQAKPVIEAYKSRHDEWCRRVMAKMKAKIKADIIKQKNQKKTTQKTT
jgi:hypothetical protein